MIPLTKEEFENILFLYTDITEITESSKFSGLGESPSMITELTSGGEVVATRKITSEGTFYFKN